MEVGDIVQETGIKTIPMEKKCKKTKWLSEQALQIAVKRRGKKQRRKGKIQAFECRVPKNSKERLKKKKNPPNGSLYFLEKGALKKNSSEQQKNQKKKGSFNFESNPFSPSSHYISSYPSYPAKC